MDPNANLAEQKALAEEILDGNPLEPPDFLRLAELVLALDEWITGGGFLPSDWQRS